MFKLLGIFYDNTKVGYKKSCFAVFLLSILLLVCYYDILNYSAVLVANCVTEKTLIIFFLNFVLSVILGVLIHPSMEIWYKNRESYIELKDTSTTLKKQNLMSRIKSSMFYKKDFLRIEDRDLSYYNSTSISCLILLFLQSFLLPFLCLSLNIYGLVGFNMPILLIISCISFVLYMFLQSFIKKMLHDLITEEQEGVIWMIKADFYLDYFNNREDNDNFRDDENRDLE